MACSETIFGHSFHAFFSRALMPQNCYPPLPSTRCGSRTAYVISALSYLNFSRGGLNGSTQHSLEVLSAGISKAKFVREQWFKKSTPLFRSNPVQPKRSAPFEEHYRINRLEGCCIDRLSWHCLSGLDSMAREGSHPCKSMPYP
jgi:hypothetical protein